VGGCSDYRGEAIDLRFADRDARDFATALRIGAERLFGTDRTHIELLTTGASSSAAARPTKESFRRALAEAGRSRPGDVFLLYLSGHGVTAADDFYYLVCSAASADLGDPAVRERTAISGRELAECLSRIPARKQAMILDTCSAGRLIESLTDMRSVPSSQVRALDRMKDRTGLFILAGCAADRVSYEATRFGQGLLTYSLLLGLRGGALREEEYVDVERLFSFAVDRVPKLAAGVGGIQRPLVAAPRAGSGYDLGRLTVEDRERIPLRRALPLYVRSNFQEADAFEDVLGLAKAVDARLAALGESTLVFVDARAAPGAYRLAGRYRIEAGRVTAVVRLLLSGKTVRRLEVTGTTGDVGSLADEIVAAARADDR
jgi:hypothetical protein